MKGRLSEGTESAIEKKRGTKLSDDQKSVLNYMNESESSVLKVDAATVMSRGQRQSQQQIERGCRRFSYA